MTNTALREKPWDARLAAVLVRPLRRTGVSPNVLTTVRLLVGCYGVYLFARGTSPNAAASLIVLSNFFDHTDGELARMTGKMSQFGHRYDLASDLLVTVGLFVGIGWGLREALGALAIGMGLAAGLAVAGIFQLRYMLESAEGKSATAQPGYGGFEAEDVLYLLPLVTLSGTLEWFLKAAALGAPLALCAVLVQVFRVRRSA